MEFNEAASSTCMSSEDIHVDDNVSSNSTKTPDWEKGTGQRFQDHLLVRTLTLVDRVFLVLVVPLPCSKNHHRHNQHDE